MYSIFILILILCLLYHINGNKDKKENFINDMDRVIREKVNNDIDIKAPELPDLGNIQYEIMKQRKPVIEKRTYETGIKNKCKLSLVIRIICVMIQYIPNFHGQVWE